MASILGELARGCTARPFAALLQYAREETDVSLDSDLFSEIMRRSLELEPAIGDVRDIGDFLAAPLHDVRNQVRKQLESRMPRKAYDTIICVPWIRTGGADLIACQLAQAVKITNPHASVLLLRTDYPNLERPDWIPADIDVVDGSDLLGAVLIDHAQMLLYSLILGLKAKNVINVNSHLCWRVLVRFGSRLSPNESLRLSILLGPKRQRHSDRLS